MKEEDWKERLNSLLFSSIDIKSDTAIPVNKKLGKDLQDFIQKIQNEQTTNTTKSITKW